MKFYSDIPALVAWDTEIDKPLQFVSGEYETDDPRIIALLQAAGFEYEAPTLPPAETEPEATEPEPVPAPKKAKK